jgi:hypothetical protein
MKTKELYLLLILFYNVFSDAPTMTNSINLDSLNTELTTTNSDTSLSTTDSPSTNSDTSLSTTDSSTTNLDTSLSTTDSSSTNSDTSLSTTDSSSTNSDTSLSTTDSSPTKSDTSLSNTDSSSANSDISLSTIDSSNGNTTTDQPRIVLVGFGHYQRLLRDLVTFRVYFKRFLTRASSRYLYFTVVLNYLRRLRVLEEQRANCTLITDNNNDMVYNCSVPVDADRDFTMSAKDDFEFSDIETNLIVSSYANSTMKSLSSQTNDIFKNGVLVLTDSTLTNNDNNFIIEGNLMDGELNDKQVILSFDENGNGNLVNATCNVNDKENKKYELICTSTQKIKAHLEGVMGRTSSEKPLLIHMASNSNDEVDLDSSSSSSKLNHIYPKTSSSGLSTGAIVGIIIPCCVVLIAAIAAAFICSKQNIAPIQEMNTLQSNSSNTMIKNYIN